MVTTVVTGVTSQKCGSWGEREALEEPSMQSRAGGGTRGVGGVASGPLTTDPEHLLVCRPGSTREFSVGLHLCS